MLSFVVLHLIPACNKIFLDSNSLLDSLCFRLSIFLNFETPLVKAAIIKKIGNSSINFATFLEIINGLSLLLDTLIVPTISPDTFFKLLIVILAFALNTHNFLSAILGLTLAWFGFQFRIVHEEKALEEKFGEDYRNYKTRTGMWFPRRGGKLIDVNKNREIEK